MEEKEVKKTTKKRTTAKKAKVEEDKKQETMTLSDIPQELLQQIIAMAQAGMQNQNQNIEEEKVEVAKKTTRTGRVTKADLNKIRDEEIIIKSSNGACSFRSNKTNILYRLADEYDEETITVGEILNMESKSKKFLHAPWIILADDYNNGETIKMIVEALGLEKLYANLIDIDELLENDLYDIEKMIEESSQDYKDVISSKIRKKIVDKELRDIVLIGELERILGKSLV